MARKLVAIGVLYLASVAAAAILDARNEDKAKEPEKKPSIVKDYICLRDGELCHPEHKRNRGLYVSCSNGVAWEQQCPKCSYHPVNCPTKSLWFDGEKCDWASPKLATQPCVDHIQSYDSIYSHQEKEGNVLSEQEALIQSLLPPVHMSAQVPHAPAPAAPVEKHQWQSSTMDLQVPTYFKSPKYDGSSDSEPAQEIEMNESSEEKEVKAAPEKSAEDEDDSSEEVDPAINIEGKSGKEISEPEYPAVLDVDDSRLQIIKFGDPVYTLVNSPDGSGKQILMRVNQPFVLQDSARSAMRSMFRSYFEM